MKKARIIKSIKSGKLWVGKAQGAANSKGSKASFDFSAPFEPKVGSTYDVGPETTGKKGTKRAVLVKPKR